MLGLAMIGGAVVSGDPSHAILPMVECVGCFVRAAPWYAHGAMSRRPPLARLFADLNRSHFGGRLVGWSVRYGRIRERYAIPSLAWDGHTDIEARTISLARGLDLFDPERKRRVLLHEMAHADDTAPPSAW
jgi:hypothetical protein